MNESKQVALWEIWRNALGSPQVARFSPSDEGRKQAKGLRLQLYRAVKPVKTGAVIVDAALREAARRCEVTMQETPDAILLTVQKGAVNASAQAVLQAFGRDTSVSELLEKQDETVKQTVEASLRELLGDTPPALSDDLVDRGDSSQNPPRGENPYYRR